ncbi:hypothetical protein ACHAXA_001776 [Cyclostephanos tholiformis]|uniref:Peptidase M43 pregnancy-associated plasma-A domain-containing protein n=1 Tax=Cyclostephanos tholiformis TaxID=382380 RepID=A0ABD3RXM1_9STRA
MPQHRPPPRLVNNLPSFVAFLLLLVIVVVIGRCVSGIARDEHGDDVGPKVYFGDLDHRHHRRDRHHHHHHHHHSRHDLRDGGYRHGAVGRSTATSRIIISGRVGKEGGGVFETHEQGSAGIFGDGGDGGDGVGNIVHHDPKAVGSSYRAGGGGGGGGREGKFSPCGTMKPSNEERERRDGYYRAWKRRKKDGGGRRGGTAGNGNGDDVTVVRNNGHGRADREVYEEVEDDGRHRHLGGCGDCVDWTSNATLITIPVHFHVVHDGDIGKMYTYEYGDGAYINRSIRALNLGFAGLPNPEFIPHMTRSYDRYDATDVDARIRFCLAGTTATNRSSWYTAGPYSGEVSDMHVALRVGGSETLNVYVSSPGDGSILGYSYYPQISDFVDDGVTILNAAMPGGPLGTYSEGDTLVHEVGHWLDLVHTHDNGCDGDGDYMSPSANEETPSFGCPVYKSECPSGLDTEGLPMRELNPIHNFMSYTNDDCMDQFTPGQIVRIQQAWETYRHKSGYSESIKLAADGISCEDYAPASETPTSIPTTSRPTMAPVTSRPTTTRPTTMRPTTRRPTTRRPTTRRPTTRKRNG